MRTSSKFLYYIYRSCYFSFLVDDDSFLFCRKRERETENTHKKTGKISANICSACYTYNDNYTLKMFWIEVNECSICCMLLFGSALVLHWTMLTFNFFFFVMSDPISDAGFNNTACRTFIYLFVYSFFSSFDENWNLIRQFIV